MPLVEQFTFENLEHNRRIMSYLRNAMHLRSGPITGMKEGLISVLFQKWDGSSWYRKDEVEYSIMTRWNENNEWDWLNVLKAESDIGFFSRPRQATVQQQMWIRVWKNTFYSGGSMVFCLTQGYEKMGSLTLRIMERPLDLLVTFCRVAAGFMQLCACRYEYSFSRLYIFINIWNTLHGLVLIITCHCLEMRFIFLLTL